MVLLFKRVSFLKNTSFFFFIFSPLPYSGASDPGKIIANFSGEIVTSSSGLIHQDIITLSELIPGGLLDFWEGRGWLRVLMCLLSV